MLLSACQTTQQNSRIIASAFNLTTGLQQKIMDRYAPKNIQVQHDIVYATQPNLSFDLYQDSQLQDLAARRQLSGFMVVAGLQVQKPTHVAILNY